MKKRNLALSMILVLTVLLSACGATAASPSDKEMPRTISVNGTGVVSLSPDMATINIGVQTQDALADETIAVTAGGGAIEITITGQQRLQAVKIDPDAVDPDDLVMLQDLIVAAVNEAIEQSQKLAADRLGALTGGLGLPPGLGLG